MDNKITNLVEYLKILAANLTTNIINKENENEINVITQALTLVIMRHISYQNKLLDHILSRNMVHIDPELIPLSSLKLILGEIEKNMKIDHMLPWSLIEKEKMIKWYQTIPMKTYIFEENIVIEFIIHIKK